MLQRIQSIWLLLAAACSFLSLKFPFYTGPTTLNAYHQLTGVDNLYLMTLTIAIGVLCLINIFLYSNRTLQLRLCVLGLFLEGLLLFVYYKETKAYPGGNHSLTALLQGLILLFLFLAAKGINNDRKIIKESNRLR